MSKSKSKPVVSVIRHMLFLAVAATLLMIAGTCGLAFVIGPRTSAPQPQDLVLDLAKRLLTASETHTVGPIPTNIPADVQIGSSRCWNLLQNAMAKNHKDYTLTVIGVFGEYGTPTGHGATEVLLKVSFPDGMQVEMQFYNYTLEVCREAATII